MEQIHGGPMAGKTVLVTGGSRRHRQGDRPGPGHAWGPTSRSPAGTASAPRTRLGRSAPPAAGRWTCSSPTCPPSRRCDDWLTRCCRHLSRIDVLVNNVGGYWNTRHVTADGLERTFALNHLAPFLLTHLLLDRLTQSAPARVVTVSSNAQAQGRIDFDDLQGTRSYSGARAYSQSKLANVLFSYELARRLQGTSVTANALHPGVVSTSFGAEDPATVQRVFIPFLRPFMKTPAQGAATSIHLASAPDLEQVTRPLLRRQQTQESSKRSYDEAAAARLWQVSADLVGLTTAARHPVTTTTPHPKSEEKPP